MLKSELLNLISTKKFEKNNILNLDEKYSNLIKDINQNSVIKNIFIKKNENQQIELLNEILKSLMKLNFQKKLTT